MPPPKQRPQLVNRRIRLLLLVLVVAFGALLARATWIQTVRASSYARLAQSQQHETMSIPAPRGTIYDRMGVQLAKENPAAVASIVRGWVSGEAT